jgi:hypothetical protein
MAARRSIAELIHIAKLPVEQQRAAFDALLTKPVRRRAPTTRPEPGHCSKPELPIRVRAVAYFNPQRFVEQRRSAANKLARVQSLVTDLQRRVDNNPARYSVSQIRTRVDRILHKESVLQVYRVDVQSKPMGGYKIALQLVSSEWNQRRLYDGWSVLVGHVRLKKQSAEQLCTLYRAKDFVEKDFQVIKSFIHLRPVRHRNDDKVRAHVGICVLSLLLERSLHNRLRRSKGPHLTAQAALELLDSCRLNFYPQRSDGHPGAYLVTETSADQRRVLKTLRMQQLSDDMHVTDMISSAI